MFGLSSIPCFGKVVDRISDATVAALFRSLQYTFRYKALVNDLHSEIEKLNGEKDRISIKVKEERDNGKLIYDDVLTWQKDVDKIQESGNQFSPSWKCIKCLPIPNPVSRFLLGKKAVLKAKIVTGLTSTGKELLAKEIAHLPPVEYVPNTDGTFRNFQSRNDAYEKLWKDLVDEDSPMIVGIYGMPGVGKTRMMQQIWKEAMERRIFKKVTLAVVGSEEMDVINIQKQIASHLGCQLVSEDDKRHRANQLNNSLKNGGKILIILDDVWKVIPLEDIIGTCLVDDKSWKGYKILLTSREKSVCLNNNCKHPVEIAALTVPEAWDLFKNTVGMGEIDSLNDEILAKEVCKKCAGLPLIIHAVAKALKSMTRNLWKDTLDKLENCNIENVGGISGGVYACLKLSFDNLEEDAKQCLLLCCLFPEDADIPMRRFIQLATGSQLVHGGRIRILAMIDILKSSSLLIQGKDDEHFKLRDIIREVATSVAVKDYAFLRARCGSRLPDHNAADYSSRKLLHLDVEKKDFHLPDDLVCPDLHTLSLQGQYEIYIPKFSGGMFVNLRFLVLIGFFSQQQFSLQSLGKLKTLFLDDCDISNTNVSFFPKKLETLCIWDCNLPTYLELPNLKYLRKLEILARHKLRMVPNTISRLTRLEELHLENPSENCDDSTHSLIPKFKEISKLTCLTSLKIFWDYFEPSQDTSIFSSLLEFDIRVGGRGKNKYRPASQVSLTRLIELTDGNNFEGFHELVGRAEEVILRKTNVDVSKIWNSNREAFEDLINLYIEHCNTMEYLARISQYEIQFSMRQQTSFSKLTILEVSNCSAMKYLLSNSVANCLVQLQQLSIFNCDLMEVIVMNEGTSDGGDIISFSNLKSLKLSYMQRLTSFYGKKRDAHSSLISDMDNSTSIPSSQSQPLFDGMVAFPVLEELELRNLEKTTDIWGNHFYNDNVSTFYHLKSLEVSCCDEMEIVIPLFMLHRLRNLEYLKIEDCNSLRNVFLPSIARGLEQLKKLEVIYCKRMREIIGQGEQEEEITHTIIIFPELTKLKLQFLPKLNMFWFYPSGEADSYKVQFPNMVDLTLHDVDINLEAIKLGRCDSNCQLKYLDISCDSEIQLPRTWKPCLHYLESLSLRYCWSDDLKFLSFQKLKVLKVLESGCSTLFTLSVLGSLQQLQELEISNCGLLEEIVEDVKRDETFGTDKKPITLFKLRAIILKDLPNLKSFFGSANYEFYMPALEDVEVINCGLFTTLFTCSVSKNLQQLQFLHVYNCRLLESIVEDARGIETSDMDDKIIELSGLLEVVLKDLPNLKTFGLTVSYAFSMPKLLYFSLFRCPGVENFTSSKASTGLVSVDSEWHQRKKVPDLNDFARQYRRRCDSAGDQPLQAAFLFFPWSCPWAS